MIKKSLIEAYNSNHKYDFICISETYLDSSASDDDKELAMEGYNFIHADHHSNVKKVVLVLQRINSCSNN